jgi:hypothetical protein
MEIMNKVIINHFESVDNFRLRLYRKDIIRSFRQASFITINNLDEDIVEVRCVIEFNREPRPKGRVLKERLLAILV